MPFLPGKPKTGGRQAGVPNRLTTHFREAVHYVYSDMGGHEAFSKWAKENQTEFYRIAARLIPTEMRENGEDNRVMVVVQR
jgi:hypothetical protein